MMARQAEGSLHRFGFWVFSGEEERVEKIQMIRVGTLVVWLAFDRKHTRDDSDSTRFSPD